MTYQEEEQFRILNFVKQYGSVTAKEASEKLQVHISTFYLSENFFNREATTETYTLSLTGDKVYKYLKAKKNTERFNNWLIIIATIAAVIAAYPVVKDWICKK